MATKQKEEIITEEQIEEMEADLTTAVPRKQQKYTGPMTDVFLPLIEGGDSEGIKVDQYEHVTIANEMGEQTWHVRRGVRTEVPVPAFIALKAKYPNI